MPPVVRRVLAFPVAYAMITAIAGLHKWATPPPCWDAKASGGNQAEL